MELEGSLKAFSLPEILQFLSMSKMTGNLSIIQADNAIELVIRNGRIVNSTTMFRQNKLGQMLVYRGVLQRSELDQALAEQKMSGISQKLGEMLIEKGMLDSATLKQVIKLQIEEEVWNLFDTEEGDFKFEHNDPDAVEDAVIEIDIEPLIIEGTRRLDEWARISQNLDSDEIVIGVRPLPDDYERDMSLTENEWRVLSLINGFYPVDSLVKRSCLGKFETYRILNSFLNANLLEIKERNTVPVSPCPVGEESESDEDTTSDADGRYWGLGQLFGRRNVEVEEEVEDENKRTPMGISCEIINEFVKAASLHRDFGVIDDNFMQNLWKECLNLYPKADLIYVTNNELVHGKMERYFQLGGYCTAIKPCLEDAQEALQELYGKLFQEASQRIGEKQAAKIIDPILKNYMNQYASQAQLNGYSIDFIFKREELKVEKVTQEG